MIGAVSSWWAVVPALAAGVAMLLLPGAIAVWPLRLRPRARWALMAPSSMAMVGCTGVLVGWLHVRYLWWQPFALAAVVGAVVWFLGGRRPPWRFPSIAGARWRLVALEAGCWAASSVASAVIAFGGVRSPCLFSQTYDNAFHLNATMSILQSGNASSFHLGALSFPGARIAFYPAAWHTTAASMAQIAGVSVPVAFAALWIAMISVAWLPGLAWCAVMVTGGDELSAGSRTATAGVAHLAGSCLGFFPYALLNWGVLYPNALAYTLIPAGLALAVGVVRSVSGRLGQGPGVGPLPQRRERLTPVAAAVLWFLGSLFAHPRSLVGVGAILIPLVAATWWTATSGRWRSDLGSRRRIATGVVCVLTAAALLAVAALVYVARRFDLAHRPISAHLTGIQARPVESVAGALGQVITLSAYTGDGPGLTGPMWLLAGLVLDAAVWAVWTKRQFRWLIVSYGIVAALFALAAGSDSVFAKLATGLWYKDRYRLSALLPALAVPLVAAFLPWLARRCADAWEAWARDAAAGRRLPAARSRSGGIALAVLAVVMAAVSWVQLAGTVTVASTRVYRLDDDPGSMVTSDQAALLRLLPTVVPPGQRVLGDPWDGAVASWVLGDREPVFPHLDGTWDPDRLVLATRLDRAGTDPAVCAAAQRLDVHYFIARIGAPGGAHSPQDPPDLFRSIQNAADRSAPVLQSGSYGLFRMDRCGP